MFTGLIPNLLAFAVGLVGLYYGAEWLVRGASRLARSAGVSPLVVGLTVVAFGTSAPELVVSIIAAIGEREDVAMGNVVGSNMINLALILGAASLIRPIRLRSRLLRREVPVMIVSVFLLFLLCLDLVLSRFDGLMLLACLVGFLLYMHQVARREAAREAEFPFALDVDLEPEPRGHSRARDVAMIVGGLVGLLVGAHLLVESATTFARAVGMSELVIGLTVIALGTSLPELATSLVAAFRRESDIAVGNIVGSNIFNVFSILGAAAFIHPMSVAGELLVVELPLVFVVSALMLPLTWRGPRLERWGGGVLLAIYVAFTVFLLMERGPTGPS